MKRILKPLWLSCALALGVATAVASEHPRSVDSPGRNALAHVPVEISKASTVFISNLGGGCYPPDSALPRDAGPDRAYKDSYEALESWGRYKLVARPSDAELVFEVSLSCALTGAGGPAAPNHYPQLVLVIRETKTRAVLWTVTQPVEARRPREKKWEEAIAALLSALKQLVAASGAVPVTASRER